MRTPTTLVLVTVMLAAARSVQAQDAASLRAAIERHYAAINAGDLETALGHHLPEFSWFSADGLPLFEAGGAEAAARMGATPDFGNPNVYMTHFNAQIHGDVGVATFYLVGTVIRGGEAIDGAWRVSAVWVRRDGEWKEAHHHESPLRGAYQG